MEEKEKKEHSRQRARDLVEKARSLAGRMSFLTEPLPLTYRGRIADSISARHGSRDIEFSHHLLSEDILWKFEFYLDTFLGFQGIQLCKIDTFHDKIIQRWFIRSEGVAFDKGHTLNKELIRKEELLDFIHSSLLETKEIFDAAYEEVEKKIDYDTMGLVRDLREKNQKIAELKNENTLLKKDIRALIATMDRSIELLEKSTKVLESTKAFLGKSKTIKGVRNRIEEVIEDLKTTLRLTT